MTTADTWLLLHPAGQPLQAAVTDPRVPVQVEALEGWHVGEHVLGQGGQEVVRQVQVLDGGRLEQLQEAQRHKGVRVELGEPVSLQLQQAERAQAVEGLGVDELDAVVVHVQPGQAPEATESLFLKFPDFVIAHF